jgi:hypothetical protein
MAILGGITQGSPPSDVVPLWLTGPAEPRRIREKWREVKWSPRE